MRISPRAVLLASAFLAAAALCQAAQPRAAAKSDALDQILEDLVGGTAGGVGMTDGIRVVDGSLSQLSTEVGGMLINGTTIQAGYFTEMAWTPVSTRLLVAGPQTISAQWTDAAPANPSGTVYTVDASTASDFSGSLTSVSTNAFSANVTNLLPNTTYYFRISAQYADDQSPFLALGALQTLTFSDVTPPSPITNLTGHSGVVPGGILLTWTATGNDGLSGPITNGKYAVGFSTDPNFSFSTATASLFFSTNTTPGAGQAYEIDSLIATDVYYARVWLADNSGNWSPLSNAATAQATPVPATDITGQVLDVSTEGITGVELDAYNAAGALIATTFTLADGSGTFDLSNLSAGNYRLVATWSVNGIASAVSLDNIPAGSAGVDFTLNLTYTLGALQGQMVSANAPPGSGGGLGVSSYRPKAIGGKDTSQYIEVYANNHRIVQMYPDADGKWKVPNLLPGPYSVRAYNGLTYTPFTPIQLHEGETAIVSFSFDPLPAGSVFAFPNPARTSTTIRFQTALQPLEAEVSIFDVAGNLIYQIPGSQIVAAGPDLYHAIWPLVNSNGQGVASGVYLAMLKVKGGVENQTAKVITKIAVVK